METNRKYDIMKDGIVMAVHIYTDEYETPYAELIFAYGGKATIQWNSADQRNEYMPGIDGYTLFYDERKKRPFDEWK